MDHERGGENAWINKSLCVGVWRMNYRFNRFSTMSPTSYIP